MQEKLGATFGYVFKPYDSESAWPLVPSFESGIISDMEMQDPETSRACVKLMVEAEESEWIHK